jgi:ribonuclease HI
MAKKSRQLSKVPHLLYTDSQAAETSTSQPWRQSGQNIIRHIVDLIDDLMVQDPRKQLEVIWITGHHGIAENEICGRRPETSSIRFSSQQASKS